MSHGMTNLASIRVSTSQVPNCTPAWDTFRFISCVVTKFCRTAPGWNLQFVLQPEKCLWTTATMDRSLPGQIYHRPCSLPAGPLQSIQNARFITRFTDQALQYISQIYRIINRPAPIQAKSASQEPEYEVDQNLAHRKILDAACCATFQDPMCENLLNLIFWRL